MISAQVYADGADAIAPPVVEGSSIYVAFKVVVPVVKMKGSVTPKYVTVCMILRKLEVHLSLPMECMEAKCSRLIDEGSLAGMLSSDKIGKRFG